MPGAKPLVELRLVPPGSALATLYTPWFIEQVDLLIAEEDGDFLTELILGMRRECVDPMTAVFAEADLLLNGWHTADLPQPDRRELMKTWSVLLTAREQFRRNT